MTKQIFKHIRPATMPILPRSPTASAVPLGSCELWPFRTHQPNGNGSHHWESNGISNNLQDAPKNPAHLSLDTVSTIKLWLLPIFGNTISIIGIQQKWCWGTSASMAASVVVEPPKTHSLDGTLETFDAQPAL